MWRASAAPVLTLAGLHWPYGPQRLTVSREAGGSGHRSVVRDPERGWTLLVDPSLPSPGAEGPLESEAHALRAAGSRQPLTLTVGGPRRPFPGTDSTARLLARVASGGALEATNAREAAALRGAPVGVDGDAREVSDEIASWFEARLLLLRERVVDLPELDPSPGGPRFDPEGLEAYWQAVAGHGLEPEGPPRRRGRRERLAGAGLHASWTVGAHSGRAVYVCLAAPERRDELAPVLAEHNLEHFPCTLTRSRPLEIEDE